MLQHDPSGLVSDPRGAEKPPGGLGGRQHPQRSAACALSPPQDRQSFPALQIQPAQRSPWVLTRAQCWPSDIWVDKGL